MIFPALKIIKDELKKNNVNADLGNISEIINDSGNNNVNADIIISLVNIEENRISRDPQYYVRTGTSVKMKNPAVHLYLTVLFTSISPGYTQALVHLQKVIGFFQENYVFDQSNPDVADAGIEKLILEMQSLNLEQLQQLWSMLGGKYHPSVAYRVRMVTIDSEPTEDAIHLVKEIDANYHLK